MNMILVLSMIFFALAFCFVPFFFARKSRKKHEEKHRVREPTTCSQFDNIKPVSTYKGSTRRKPVSESPRAKSAESDDTSSVLAAGIALYGENSFSSSTDSPSFDSSIQSSTTGGGGSFDGGGSSGDW